MATDDDYDDDDDDVGQPSRGVAFSPLSLNVLGLDFDSASSCSAWQADRLPAAVRRRPRGLTAARGDKKVCRRIKDAGYLRVSQSMTLSMNPFPAASQPNQQ